MRYRIFLIRLFLLGMYEFRSMYGRYWDNVCDPRSQAYDWGREWAHRLTFRRYED
jgi:hypothetical protein